MRLSEHIALLREEFDRAGLDEAHVYVFVNRDGTVNDEHSMTSSDPALPRRNAGQFSFKFTRRADVSGSEAAGSCPATP
jgi:hypothetical protein